MYFYIRIFFFWGKSPKSLDILKCEVLAVNTAQW